ncbi:MAG: S8 family serine peptidase [Candidatus Limnocylindrus sp.]
MTHTTTLATPRGARRTFVLIAMLAAALIAPSAAAANRHKALPAGVRPVESKVLLRGVDKDGALHLVVTLRTPGIGAPLSAGGMAQPYALQGAQIRERFSARAAITALGGTVHAEYRYIMNGLRVHIPASQLEALRANPHVADVQLVTRHNRMTVSGGAFVQRGGALPSNANAATEVQAKNVWAQTATSKAGTGYGVKVAVIDTGIDYTHDTFVRNGDVTFPTAKVVAGYDLVGDNYAPGNGGLAEVPQPDSDPMDCSIEEGGGHGTHVAGTIAGFGIKANGTTYGIPSTERYTSALNISSFKLAPGIAPLASLIAIRVFGCEGGTELAADGIEKAVALGAKVINLSLGSPYGIKGGAEQAAINAAEKAGATVVVAAGNDGSEPFLVGSPSTEDGAISVAALNDRPTFPGATISYPFGGIPRFVGGGTGIGFLNTNVMDLSTTVTANIISLKQQADATLYSLGCPATGDGGATYTPDWDTSRSDLSGKIVILRRGICTFKEKVDAMIAKGVVGVVILQRADIIAEPDTTSYPPFQGPGVPTSSIPVLMANGDAENALVNSLVSDDVEGNNVTIAALTAGVANPDYRTVADFSSGGPRWGDLALKPEVAAPGVDIVSAASGSGDGVAWFSGTSMATPVVAGVAALVRQANPTWTPSLIKSALINTAKSVGSKIPLRSVGAGRVNALNAVKAKVTIDAGPNATLSYGMVYGDASATLTRNLTFKVTNKGTTSAGYKFAVAAATGFAIPYGVTLKVYNGSKALTSSSTVTIRAGASKTLTLRLTASAAGQKRFAPQYNVDPTDGLISELSGALNVVVTATSSGKPTLRLPVIGFLRHTERFSFSEAAGTLSGSITSGTNDAQEADGTALEVPVFPYVWLGRDGRERIGNGADIKNIGFNARIGDDWATDPVAAGWLDLLVTSWDRAWNIAMNEYDVVFDTDLDGAGDQTVIVVDHGLVTSGYADGIPGCFYLDHLDWFGGGVDGLYLLTSEECTVYAPAGSSAMQLSIIQGYLWDNAHGASFSITTYNGGGWDSDSTAQYKVSFVEVASGPTYASTMDCHVGLYVDGCALVFDSAGTTSSIASVPVDGDGDGGWGTDSLGWLLWNDWHAGPTTEIYEVLISPPL